MKTIVLDGNKKYWVVIDGSIRYNGDNPLVFWYHRLFTKGNNKVTVKYGK